MTGFFERQLIRFRRDILRDPFLLEVKRWFGDNGDSTLRLDYPLDQDSVVWDLGGYHGDFAAAIHQRYGCHVFVFEPVPEFHRQCVERFAGNAKIHCLMYGLSDRAGRFPVSDRGDASSFVRDKSLPGAVQAELRSVADAFAELGVERVDLLKINIEGGEYDVLPALVDAGLMARVRFLQVQFHDFIPGAVARRDAIRAALARTHTEMWNYRFVWESWARKDNPASGAAP